MKVILLGYMVASCQAFVRLEKELQRRNIDVVSYLADGKSYKMSPERITYDVCVADIVVLGMANAPDLAEEELAVAELRVSIGKPIAFYADTYNSWARPHFKDAIEKASVLFVINESEVVKARRFFKNSNLKIVASGNPIWEDFCFPAISREEVRAKLKIADGEKLILCPFGKSFVVNTLLAGGVIQAVYYCGKIFTKTCKIVLAHHPGDKNPPEAYGDLCNSKEVSVRIVDKANMPTSHILAGSDLVVESASTIGIEAAHLRIPIINYFTEISSARLEKQIGTREWEPCRLGVSRLVAHGSIRHLGNEIRRMLDKYDSFRNDLLNRQAEVYMAPAAKGAAVSVMADALAKVVGCSGSIG